MFACMYVCTTCGQCPWRPEEAIRFLGLELQMVAGIRWELGTNPNPPEEPWVISPVAFSLLLVSHPSFLTLSTLELSSCCFSCGAASCLAVSAARPVGWSTIAIPSVVAATLLGPSLLSLCCQLSCINKSRQEKTTYGKTFIGSNWAEECLLACLLLWPKRGWCLNYANEGLCFSWIMALSFLYQSQQSFCQPLRINAPFPAWIDLVIGYPSPLRVVMVKSLVRTIWNGCGWDCTSKNWQLSLSLLKGTELLFTAREGMEKKNHSTPHTQMKVCVCANYKYSFCSVSGLWVNDCRVL